jgi:two-component system chemotaxis response regulator CheB
VESRKNYRAIVIGTSAGGFSALSAILQDLPSDFPIPVVIVQHRAKDQSYLLEDLLQAKCQIKIKQADEKEEIQPGQVYLAPPDYHLLVERDATLSLSSDLHVRYSRPSIDVLFESAAIAFGDRLIAIILTGASNDGASGIKKVKEFGGLTIVQDPEEAAFSHMPKAAVDTGQADEILRLAQISSFLKKTIPH